MTADEWISTKLGTVAEFGNGGAWSQGEYTTDGIRVVRVSDVDGDTIDLSDCKYLSWSALDKYKRHMLRTGDLVVCTVGSHPTQPASVVGRAVVVPKLADGSLLNQNAVRIRPASRSIDAGWLGFLGRSRLFHEYIIGCARGAASQVRMPIGLLKEMQISVPPLRTQQRISLILSAYDDLIENNTRRIAIVEEMARRTYEEWFIRFRFPGHDEVPMVDSEFGLVPEGWVIAKLGTMLSLVKGLSYKGAGLSGPGVPMINLKNILPGGGFRRDGTKTYSGDYKPRHVIRTGDIVVANTDLTQAGMVVGSPAIVPDLSANDCIFSHHIYAVRLQADFVAARSYVYWLLAHSSFKSFARGFAVGTTVLGMPKEGVTSFTFAQPPLQLIFRFSALADSFHDLAETLRAKNTNLRTTRDFLLPKLISGELDVSAMTRSERIDA